MASFGVEDGPTMRDLKWSRAEKTLARKAFDLALQREFEAVKLSRLLSLSLSLAVNL
jgi:hypothetical protein